MKYHSFYMRVLCLLLIIGAVVGYNFMSKNNTQAQEIEDLKERVTTLENQQTEILTALEDAAKGRPIYYDEICMYAGASGILCFLLGLYDATKDSIYLEEAKEAGLYRGCQSSLLLPILHQVISEPDRNPEAGYPGE